MTNKVKKLEIIKEKKFIVITYLMIGLVSLLLIFTYILMFQYRSAETRAIFRIFMIFISFLIFAAVYLIFTVWERFLKKSVEKVKNLRELSLTHYQKGEFNKSIENIKDAINIDPKDYTLFYELAKIYLDTQRYEEAYDACNRSLGIEPEFEEANTLLEKINSLKLE